MIFHFYHCVDEIAVIEYSLTNPISMLPIEIQRHKAIVNGMKWTFVPPLRVANHIYRGLLSAIGSFITHYSYVLRSRDVMENALAVANQAKRILAYQGKETSFEVQPEVSFVPVNINAMDLDYNVVTAQPYLTAPKAKRRIKTVDPSGMRALLTTAKLKTDFLQIPANEEHNFKPAAVQERINASNLYLQKPGALVHLYCLLRLQQKQVDVVNDEIWHLHKENNWLKTSLSELKRRKKETEQELRKATKAHKKKLNVIKKTVRGTEKCKAAKKAESAQKKRKKSEVEEEQEAQDDLEKQLSSSGSSSTLYSDDLQDPNEDGKPQPSTSRGRQASMMTQRSPRGALKI